MARPDFFRDISVALTEVDLNPLAAMIAAGLIETDEIKARIASFTPFVRGPSAFFLAAGATAGGFDGLVLYCVELGRSRRNGRSQMGKALAAGDGCQVRHFLPFGSATKFIGALNNRTYRYSWLTSLWFILLMRPT